MSHTNLFKSSLSELASFSQSSSRLSEQKNDGKYFCVGSNHKTAEISLREQLYLSPEQIAQTLPSLSSKFQIHEMAVLSTCNRCEVYGFANTSKYLSNDDLKHLYKSLHEMARSSGSKSSKFTTTEDVLSNSLYSYIGTDAIAHGFSVVASLDSLIPGETQITGQFKDAFAISKQAGTIGPMLNRFVQEAISSAKKVRNQTGIGRHRISISHAAIDLAKRASEDLSQINFLIIGAGEMARVAAEYAVTYKPKALVIANRSQSRAQELCKHLNYGSAKDISNLHELLIHADVVISATSAEGFVISKSDIKKAMKARAEGSLFLIDIALPRDIDPDIADLDDVYLFDIDDLKSVVDSHIEKRKEALSDAANIVEVGVFQFNEWVSQQNITPTFAASQRYFNHILQKECSKTLSRDLFNNISEKQKEALHSMLEAISSRFTGDIAKTLRELDPIDARQMADALNQLFKRD